MAALIPVSKRSLTPAQYSGLADVPPELEWLANITNPKTLGDLRAAALIALVVGAAGSDETRSRVAIRIR